MTVAWSAPEPLRAGSLEARASLGFKLLAGIELFGVILAVFPQPEPVSLLWTVAFNAAALAHAVMLVLVARGLDARRPWAAAAARPLAALVLAAGLAAVILALADDRLRIPFEAAIAIWILLGFPEPEVERRVAPSTVAVVAVATACSVVMLSGSRVFDWGSALDVTALDLHAALKVDCGSADGAPPTIGITYDWSWSRWAPLPNAVDAVIIGWDSDDPQGHPVYLLGDSPSFPHGIRTGGQDAPSLGLAIAIEKETRGSWDWGVDLFQQQLAPGHITMTLNRSPVAVAPSGAVRITATYVHLGLWRSDSAAVTCSW